LTGRARSTSLDTPVLHGILLVDKPSGPTSHDVVAQARRHFSTRGVGHAGTLDPMASGLLVLLFGEATKLSSVITNGDKSYRARIAFGRSTDSYDAQGRTVLEEELPRGALSEDKLRAALEQEAGRSQQVPPSVSAIKIGGERAYRLHHAGKPPELEPRPVAVRALTMLEWSEQSLTLELSVSKGYYVRALARDLGLALGVPLHLSELRRMKSGNFGLDQACSWPPPPGTLPMELEQTLRALLPVLRLSESGVLRARQGKLLEREHFLDDPPAPSEAPDGAAPALCAWLAGDGLPIALGHCADGKFTIVRGFSPALAPRR
jgi:tRNA pseudouridine55 synthase